MSMFWNFLSFFFFFFFRSSFPTFIRLSVLFFFLSSSCFLFYFTCALSTLETNTARTSRINIQKNTKLSRRTHIHIQGRTKGRSCRLRSNDTQHTRNKILNRKKIRIVQCSPRIWRFLQRRSMWGKIYYTVPGLSSWGPAVVGSRSNLEAVLVKKGSSPPLPFTPRWTAAKSGKSPPPKKTKEEHTISVACE